MTVCCDMTAHNSRMPRPQAGGLAAVGRVIRPGFVLLTVAALAATGCSAAHQHTGGLLPPEAFRSIGDIPLRCAWQVACGSAFLLVRWLAQGSWTARLPPLPNPRRLAWPLPGTSIAWG